MKCLLTPGSAIFRFPCLPACLCLAIALLLPSARGYGGDPAAAADEASQCIIVELYVADNQPESEQALIGATRVADARPGIRLVSRSITGNEKARERLRRIAQYFRFDENATPVIYACNRVMRFGNNADDFERQLKTSLQIEIFTRQGCQHCAAAKLYMPTLQQRFPGLDIVYRDITIDSIALSDLNDLVRRHRKAATSTPVFHLCNDMVVGFDRPETTGPRLERVLDRWSKKCPAPPTTPAANTDNSNLHRSTVFEVADKAPF